MKVREAVYRWMQQREVRYVFGNPGSTELPFLTDLPAGVNYVLALQESIAVAMADGYAQGMGRPALVNLHVAPGLGNAMGALFTALKNKAPLVVTAGQQDTRHRHWEPLLAADLVAMARPVVKWAREAQTPEQVPALLEQAWAVAAAPPQGPAFVSIPMNFWDAEIDEKPATALSGSRAFHWGLRGTGDRTQDGDSPGASPGPGAAGGELEAVGRRLAAGEPVCLVVGAGVDRAGPHAWQQVVSLAEALGCPVYGEPLAPRAVFPGEHPLWRGYLLPAAPLIARELAPYRTVVVIGAPVFLLYPYLPGPFVPPGAQVLLLTDDAEEAARSPAHAVWLGELPALLERLQAAIEQARRPATVEAANEGTGGRAEAERARRRAEAARGRARMEPAFVLYTLARVIDEVTAGSGAIVVDEASLASLAVRDFLPVRGPGSYFSAASGGLGWGMPAAVGLKLAHPNRMVVAVVGDGSAMYSIQALWTADRLGAGVKFILLNNRGYGILKAFARTFYPGTEERLPGLDLPGLDLVGLARAMGVGGEGVAEPAALEPALRRALASRDPYLVDVAVSRSVRALM